MRSRDCVSILEIFQHEVYVNIVYGISAFYLLHLPRPPRQYVFRMPYVRSIYVLCLGDYLSYFYCQKNESSQGTCMKRVLSVK